MKQLFLLSLVSLLIVRCRKDVPPGTSDYLATAKRALQDSLEETDFEALDFGRAARLKVDSLGFYALRVPFKGKVSNEDFVLVQTNAEGRVEKGKIVHLQGSVTDDGNGSNKRKRWDGRISLASLDRKADLESPIVDGVITAFHQQNRFRAALQAPQEDIMPEIIITYVRSSGGGFSWSSWFYLQSFFGSGDSGWGGYYSSFSSGGGGSESWSGGGGNSGGDGGGSTGGDANDPVILVDLEVQDENDPIDIEKYINCFNAIPDAGATCSIEILADIPVDNDPNKIFNFDSRTPGHTFLNIRKSNGGQSVSQNIGFYPKNGWKTILTNAPIDGKFVDNGQHEFNCGFKIYITPAQLHAVVMEMERDKESKYDIDNYNCTDWALDVFNAAGGNLQIPLYDIPGNLPSGGTSMPNGVYNKLLEMKNSNDPRAGGITIGIVKGYAGNSNGPCN